MEGPSIVILKEEVRLFTRKKIIKAAGNTKIDLKRLEGQTVQSFKSWGKHFLICFRGFSVRIHFLMFGSYRVNSRKDATPRMALTFKNGELNCYTCSVQLIDGDLDEVYDWEVDVMGDQWNETKAITTLKKLKKVMICDALLDQEIFAGCGNIIKNEVLFRVKIHPETEVKALNNAQLKQIVREVRAYSFEFYKWKKKFELRKHWLIYTKKKCPQCGGPVSKKYTGKGNRRSFFCPNCQIRNKVKK